MVSEELYVSFNCLATPAVADSQRVNARPVVSSLKLSELDEFLIIANNGLGDFITYQATLDIARSERADSTITAQKLRDFAVGYDPGPRAPPCSWRSPWLAFSLRAGRRRNTRFRG
ncbi:hypothetical protein EI94DRAFT_392533 [Lactarius quietus]|nr:hypothetical protein EI94DRAFT_392533 [Lactarius quietus]